jgi:hypothetical protein
MKRLIILFLFCLITGLLTSCSTPDEKKPPMELFLHNRIVNRQSVIHHGLVC